MYLEKDVLKWPCKEDTVERGHQETDDQWRSYKLQWMKLERLETTTVICVFHQSQLYGRVTERSHCWKCHMTSRLQFARRHEEDSEARWKSRLWSDETEIELLAIKLNAMFGVSQLLCIVRSTPFRPWSMVMLWGSSLKSMQPNTGKEILEENLMQSETPATQEMIYFPGQWPKHEAEATQEVLKWPSRDLNQIENLWLDSKKAVHSQSP